MLFSLFGTTFGAGDGSSTFNIPDLRGRVVAGKDDMGGSAASRLSGTGIITGGATTLGGSGGAETKTLLTANLPPYTPGGTITNGAISIGGNAQTIVAGSAISNSSPSGAFQNTTATVTASQATSTFTGTPQGGTSSPVVMLQPTIIANKLLRII
ncbi:tail fiber protein [Bradyrhizobium sp. SEMIA]|uniref:tail fiber protein n=1 Tax=Bradyrhizobium sp. SEMIA TaxID=2597515 RepID=UPI0018A3F381|nr:tail fiber protein [Bradyrhizobium sp. SEMIA]QOG22050.1 hypothetical protein FOM02_36935 [Bradyrhizobium sp. SEMIA]